MDAEASSAEPVKGVHHFVLRPGTKLFEFEIEEVLGHGGFGITYRAFDTTLKETVAVKEFFPNALAGRVSSITVSAKSETDQEDFAAGLRAFLEEARLITRFRHPNIVHVRRFFEMHGTGYIVLDYERGQTLSKRLGGGAVPVAELRGILNGMLAGLEAMHDRVILHRDLKPSNVIIREDGTPVLIDFGAARDFAGRNSRSITAIAAPGYSPPEQYGVGGQQQGPWTDLYSLGAIAYRCVTGTVPIDSLRRLRKDPLVPAVMAAAGKYDPALLGTIDWMLKLEERERPASINAVRAALARSAPPASPRMRRPLLWAATAAVALMPIAAAMTGPGRVIGCDKLGLFCADQTKTVAADAAPKTEMAPPATPTTPIAGTTAVVVSPNNNPSVPAPESIPPTASAPNTAPVLPSAVTADTASAAQATAKPLQIFIPLSDAAEAWAATKDTTSIAVLEAFAAHYKDTFYGELARTRVEELKRQHNAALTQPSTSAASATAPGLATPAIPAATPGAARASGQDEAAWDKLKESRDPDRWRAFLDQNQTSLHRAEATARVAALEPKVTDCDTLAANPDDSRKASVKGVDWILFDAAIAGAACEKAIQDFPDALRLQYQLGRAYLKLKKYYEARRRFAKAADSGYPAAMQALGVMYSTDAQGVTKDFAESRRWHAKAADLGYAPAMSSMAWFYRFGNGLPKDLSEARRWYQKAADLGFPGAMNAIGNLYEYGQGVPQDYTEARNWYMKAVELGDAVAMDDIGDLYANGRGLTRDYVEARRWYEKAAALNNTFAMNDIANLYANGQGVERNYVEARKWYGKAADLDNTVAMNNLGWLYVNGQGGPPDFAIAMRLFSKSADFGSSEGMFSIGNLYDQGRGVPQNYTEALKWWHKAADLGLGAAMVNIGFAYVNGRGVSKDYSQARYWYEKAAQVGVTRGMMNLAGLYAAGAGGPRDIAEARRWFAKAAEQGFDEAKQALRRLGR